MSDTSPNKACGCIITAIIGFKIPVYETTNKMIIEPQHEISNTLVCATSKGSDQAAHTRSLIRAYASRLNILGVLSY